MLKTRTATAQDAALITAHRRAMFAEMRFSQMGGAADIVLDQMSSHFESWVVDRLSTGQYLGWIVEDNRGPVAGAGMQLVDSPPHPLDPSGELRGHILNVYVEPEYRRRGLARTLVDLCLDEARRRGIRVVGLHASDAGRGLYQACGFRATNEMRCIVES